MTLVLTILRCPDAASPETRRVAGGELRIGRDAARADWVLRDPDQTLSRQHCVVRFDGARWQVADTSTNGTFLNCEAKPIGAESRPLGNGDRLRLGAYEIEARVEEQRPESGTQQGWANPFGTSARTGEDMFGGGSMAMPDELFADPFSPLNPKPARTTPDHTPAFTDAIRPQQARPQLTDDWEREFEFLGTPRAPPVIPDVPPPGPDPFAEPSDAPAPPASPPRAAKSASPAAEGDNALLAAFMEGAGLGDLMPQDPLAAMRNAGAAFRAFAAGLREALMVRAEIKSAMRIDPTITRAHGNNPLKFSAGDDDALMALLGTGRRTSMTPQAAVAEALRDLRHHEQATLPAVQTALRTLLDRLDPALFRAAVEQGGLALPAQRRARAFDLMEAAYRKLRADLADDFDRAFGQTFASAYEAIIDDLLQAEKRG